MNELVKKLLTIVLIVAALGFTFYNYLNGKVSMLALCLVVFMLGRPAVTIISSIISDLKDR